MKTPSAFTGIAATAGQAVEVVELPKKLTELAQWIAAHPVQFSAILLVAAVCIVTFNRKPQPKQAAQCLIERRRHTWRLLRPDGEEIGAYPSRKKAKEAALKFYADRGPVVIYVRNAKGEVVETMKAGF